MKRFGNIQVIADSDVCQSAVRRRTVSLAEDNQAALTICAVVHDIPTEMRKTPAAVARAEPSVIPLNERQGHLGPVLKSTPPDVAGPVGA
jgi:hypothetical protein